MYKMAKSLNLFFIHGNLKQTRGWQTFVNIVFLNSDNLFRCTLIEALQKGTNYLTRNLLILSYHFFQNVGNLCERQEKRKKNDHD